MAASGLKRKRSKNSDVKGRKKPQSENDEDQVISDDGMNMDDIMGGGAAFGMDEDEDQSGEDGEGDDDDGDKEMQDTAETSAPNGKHAGKSRARNAPTAEEIRKIREAHDLFMSNTFKLQIDALLPRIQPSSSRTPPLDAFLLKLYEHILGIKSVSPRHPLEAARKLEKKGVAVPYPWPAPPEDIKWTVAFHPPTDIKLVGSWANKVSVKHRDNEPFGVDLAIEIPDSLLQEKDYLNFRFFHKRAFYLAVIAASVQSAFDVEVTYESVAEDVRRTVLLIRHKSEFTKLNAVIRIIPTLSSSCPLALSKLSPSHSSVRAAAQATAESTSLATPLYNNLVLQSRLPTQLLLSIYSLKHDVSGFANALALLRVWANQRGYGKAGSVVTGFERLGHWWACVLMFLVRGEELELDVRGKKVKSSWRTLGRGLSSYQLFRAALDFLGRHDFSKGPIFMKLEGPPQTKFPRSEWNEHHSAVFVDPSGNVNLLAGVPLSSLELLRHDAQLTLGLLDQSVGDPFESVFLRDLRDLPTRFDTVLRISIQDAKPRKDIQSLALDHGSLGTAIIHSIATTVREALGSRVKAAAVLQNTSQNRSIKQAHPTSSSLLYIGIIHDPTQAGRLVDHGPSADDQSTATAAFRDFWGEKAELRRFKDGNIQEAVVWEPRGKGNDARTSIPGQVVEYVIKRHFGIEAVSVVNYLPMFDTAMELPANIVRLYSSVQTEAAPFRPALTAFDGLVKAVKANEELPLSLVTASPTSEGLRYSSVFPPIPLNLERYSAVPECARYLPAQELVFQFEKSARWPDELAAIQKIKLAFFEAVARGLTTSIVGVRTQIALDPDVSPIQDNSSLEIVLPEGIAFRARIYHDRERTLLDRILEDKSIPGSKKAEAEAALELHQRRFIHSPRHHAAILAMHHRHPSYSHTTRLVKRWLSAHLLTPHLPPELTELICASVYLSLGVYDIPSTGTMGFARVVRMIRDWDWKTEPLIVPVYSAAGVDATLPAVFPSEKRGQAELLFQQRRSADPGMAKCTWVIVTEEDLSGGVWGETGRGPAVFVAERIREVAKATWTCLEEGMRSGSLSAQALFEHPLGDYDFLIHLEPAINPRYWQNIQADSSVWAKKIKYVNLLPSGQDSSHDVLVDFDPFMAYFRDVQRIYGDTLALFYDPHGGSVIGGVWNPQLNTPRPFRVFLGFSSMPDNKSKKQLVTVNHAAVLSEIERMGKGLIKDIVVRH